MTINEPEGTLPGRPAGAPEKPTKGEQSELPEGVDPLWNREQAAKYLNVHIKTVSQLIKQYRLPAVKLGKGWRFRLIDLQIYMVGRLTIRGLIALNPYVFQDAVLDKYQDKTDLPEGSKYYRHDEGHYGRVGNRRNWHDWKSGGKPSKNDFVDVFYNKIRLMDSQVVIVVQSDELERIPPSELGDWYRFKIANPESLPWPWT